MSISNIPNRVKILKEKFPQSIGLQQSPRKHQLVPLRPNRVEPRVVKRRSKPFPRMQQPRSVLKAKRIA